jgi:hypothetical protein
LQKNMLWPRQSLTPGNVRRIWEHAGRQQNTLRFVNVVLADCLKNVRRCATQFFNLIADDSRAVTQRVLASPIQQLVSRNTERKAEIILNVRLPLRERASAVDHESVAFGAREINRRGKSGETAADNDHVVWFGHC